MLWIEKYRPKNVESFEAPDHIKELLKSKEPHLLLYGPPGTGKTTFAHLFGSTVEFNASDERGIDTIRTRIKDLSLTNKTIILDECDTLTTDAQHSLRRIIECSKARFIFITNYLTKIIIPLRSRLLKIKFELKPDNFQRLKNIGEIEGLKLDDEFYKNIFKFCKYDLRKSINLLQILKPLNNFDLHFFGQIPDDFIRRFYKLKITDVPSFIDDFIKNSYSLIQFLNQIEDDVSEYEGLIFKGCDTEIILNYICYSKVKN